MNFVARNPDTHEFYVVSISRSGERYVTSSLYLYPNGSLRVRGSAYAFGTRNKALEKAHGLLRSKRRLKGFEECLLSELPDCAARHLRPELDTFVDPTEMLRMVREAKREFYVEFQSVSGIEDRFDMGLEYLALRDEQDEDYYHVWDRYGVQCCCHYARFSRLDPTERQLEVRGGV